MERLRKNTISALRLAGISLARNTEARIEPDNIKLFTTDPETGLPIKDTEIELQLETEWYEDDKDRATLKLATYCLASKLEATLGDYRMMALKNALEVMQNPEIALLLTKEATRIAKAISYDQGGNNCGETLIDVLQTFQEGGKEHA